MERNVIKLKVDNKDKDLATYLKPQWSWKTLATIGIFSFVLVFVVNDLEIDFIKLDVDGSELMVLKSGIKFFIKENQHKMIYFHLIDNLWPVGDFDFFFEGLALEPSAMKVTPKLSLFEKSSKILVLVMRSEQHLV